MSVLKRAGEEVVFAAGIVVWTVLSVFEWRVAPKARKLDRLTPGWYQKVNLDTLDGGNDRRCVLGQVYGDYNVAPWRARGRFFGVPTAVYCLRDTGWAKAVQERREREAVKLYGRHQVDRPTVEIEEEEWS